MPIPRLLTLKFWGFHLLALVLVGTAVMLGLWQYDAWGQHRDHEARDLTTVEPVPLDDLLGPDDPFMGEALGRPVEVHGTWVPESTVFVSGREKDGRDGFWVVTPVAVEEPGDPAVLVVRGWAPSVERAPAPPTGETELVGLLQPAEGARGKVDDDPNDDVLPQLRLADAIQHVDQDLYGGYVVATDRDEPLNAGTDGLEWADVDQLPEVGKTTALRNLLYAIEWWVFGLFAGFIWWRWVRDEAARGTTPAAG